MRGWIALLLLTGCASLVHPGPAHLAWARQRQPDLELADLAEGRAAYVRECSNCHGLKLPRSQPPDAWAGILDEMAHEEEVILSPEDHDRILLFLEAAATVTDEEIEAAAAAEIEAAAAEDGAASTPPR